MRRKRKIVIITCTLGVVMNINTALAVPPVEQSDNQHNWIQKYETNLEEVKPKSEEVKINSKDISDDSTKEKDENEVKDDKLEEQKNKPLFSKKSQEENKELKWDKPKYINARGAASTSGSSIVEYSFKFLGKPYRWGAKGPNSFDCSGFTLYVFSQFGIKLPRVSREQAKVGRYIPRDKLQPGDLVFFKKKGRSVHHVGIYVGNNSYIHSPQSGDVVKISPLTRSDYYTARRMVE